MKFKNIKFVERNGKYGKTYGLFACGGRHWVEKRYFRLMWQTALDELPKLDWSRPKVTKSFFAAEDWKDFKIGKKIALGRCLKFFVDHDMLPLRVANPDKKGPRRYIKK